MEQVALTPEQGPALMWGLFSCPNTTAEQMPDRADSAPRTPARAAQTGKQERKQEGQPPAALTRHDQHHRTAPLPRPYGPQNSRDIPTRAVFSAERENRHNDVRAPQEFSPAAFFQPAAKFVIMTCVLPRKYALGPFFQRAAKVVIMMCVLPKAVSPAAPQFRHNHARRTPESH